MMICVYNLSTIVHCRHIYLWVLTVQDLLIVLDCSELIKTVLISCTGLQTQVS